jgi:hypothetical protein
MNAALFMRKLDRTKPINKSNYEFCPSCYRKGHLSLTLPPKSNSFCYWKTKFHGLGRWSNNIRNYQTQNNTLWIMWTNCWSKIFILLMNSFIKSNACHLMLYKGLIMHFNGSHNEQTGVQGRKYISNCLGKNPRCMIHELISIHIDIMMKKIICEYSLCVRWSSVFLFYFIYLFFFFWEGEGEDGFILIIKKLILIHIKYIQTSFFFRFSEIYNTDVMLIQYKGKNFFLISTWLHF